MRREFNVKVSLLVLTVIAVSFVYNAYAKKRDATSAPPIDPNDPVLKDAMSTLAQGRQIFRFDTFGDEAFWGGTLQLHHAIEGSALGGSGNGLSPRQALML